jgi:hypothetical protein
MLVFLVLKNKNEIVYVLKKMGEISTESESQYKSFSVND